MVVRPIWPRLVAKLVLGAVVADRSDIEAGPVQHVQDGPYFIYVSAHRSRSMIELPGLSINIRKRPYQVAGDIPIWARTLQVRCANCSTTWHRRVPGKTPRAQWEGRRRGETLRVLPRVRNRIPEFDQGQGAQSCAADRPRGRLQEAEHHDRHTPKHRRREDGGTGRADEPKSGRKPG